MTSAIHPNPFLYLQQNATDNPSGVFFRSSLETMTNAEAVIEVKKLAYELRRLGVQAGQIVALDLPDQLNILFSEAVYHEAAISTVIPDGIVVEGIQIDWIFSRKTPTPQLGARVVTVDAQFLRNVAQNPYGISPSDAPIDILRIAFSSGTTGRPNAVALRRNMEVLMDAALPTWFRGSPYLIMMDMGTIWGFGEFFLSVKGKQPFLSSGGASPAAIVRVASENSIKTLKGSPAQVAAVVDELESHGRTLPHLETVSVAGTVMPPGLAHRVRAAAEGCNVFVNYGSTEAGAATIRTYDSEDPFDAGHVVPGSAVEIVDENDEPVPDGESGRIRLRNAGMVKEYLGNPEATEKAFKDGWFYPGDLGMIRADKGLSLTGRESEVLNAGGVKIDPTRIDHFAIGLPQVTDACSFGYTASSGLTQIGIALVTDDDIDVQQVIAHLAAEFGNAAPKLVARIESIPRNKMGKPMRRTLAAKYSEN